MATRSKKVTTTTTSSASSSMETPKAGMSTTPGSARARASPLSPTRLSRLQEKAELQGLNDRLASYIDRVRQLEKENRSLNVQMETVQESMMREVTTMKDLYEKELSDARGLMDETAKEKVQLQIDYGKLNSANEEIRLKLAKKERDLAAAEKALTNAESQVNELSGKLNLVENDRKKMLAEIKELREEVARLGKRLAENKMQLEQETLMRVDLENKVQSAKEDLIFKTQVYEKEISQTMKRKQVELSELDGKLQGEYDARMQTALQELREDYEDKMRANNEQMEYIHQTKMDELNRRDQRYSEDSETLQGNLREARQRVQELSSRLTLLESTNNSLSQRVSDLEAQLESERDDHQAEVISLKEEIARLQMEMETQLAEYQDLMGIKVALDMEIATYRKMLECEEARLNISVSSTPAEATPVRRTPLRGLKRKRQVEETVIKAKEEFQSTSRSQCDIQITEDCPEGKFVKLQNTSDKDFAIGSFQVIRTAGDAQTVYKFHSKSKVPAGATVTIWSCDAEATHDPPLDIVMKNQKWAVSDSMATKLFSSSEVGEAVAVRESKREVESVSTSSIETPEAKEEEEEEVSRLYTGCILA